MSTETTAQVSENQLDKTKYSEGRYLTFTVNEEDYGIGILKVREIISTPKVTAIPLMPRYLKGVINLRGSVIPVIDLRLRLGLEEQEGSEAARRVVVVDVGNPMGIIVDSVREVVDIGAESIEPPPSVCEAVDASYILGMGKVGETVKILLDIDRVLTDRALSEVASVYESCSHD